VLERSQRVDVDGRAARVSRCTLDRPRVQRRVSSMLPTTNVCGAGDTHAGGRPSNQDVLIVEPDLGLYAVLDGMGGANAGDVAAHLAGEALARFTRKHIASQQFSARELLEFAIDTASAAVFLAGKQQPAYAGMGTTVVACLVVDPTSVVIGHVGDSR